MKAFDIEKELVVVLEGGLVSGICTANPELLEILKTVVIVDYSVEDAEPGGLTYINQGSNPPVLAAVRYADVGLAAISASDQEPPPDVSRISAREFLEQEGYIKDEDRSSDVAKTIEAHKYLYYVLNMPIISDREYDRLCSDNGIDGTCGSSLEADYPEEIRELALAMRRGEK